VKPAVSDDKTRQRGTTSHGEGHTRHSACLAVRSSAVPRGTSRERADSGQAGDGVVFDRQHIGAMVGIIIEGSERDTLTRLDLV